jgi:hypothetical protein
MKLLTATAATQGQRASDFAWCVPGEVVTPGVFICDRDRLEGPDGGCGCGRSFAGLNSRAATTTAVVADLDGYTLDDLTVAVAASRQAAGWAEMDADPAQAAREEAEMIAETAAEYAVGDVVEIRLGEVARR